jgi:nicotinamide riboside kinase
MNLILIMGKNGTGKTTFAEKLVSEIQYRGYPVAWLNGDDIREEFLDDDYSVEGLLEESMRMHDLAKEIDQEFVVVDLTCPTNETRILLDPKFIVYMDTAKTNEEFSTPPCDMVDVCFEKYPEQEDVVCVADKILTWL